MYELSNPTVVKSLLARHNASLSKSLGQNFLINPSVCPRMAEMGGAARDVCALEIGPGLGVLTVELARRAKKVVAVELDTRLLPILSETLSDFDNVRVINGDVMKTDLSAIIRDDFGGGDTIICANLPYYITSPVIMYLLESRLPVRSVTVMVQKEVAHRLCAEPGGKDAGAVSCAVSYFSQPRLLFNVPSGSFLPQPKVDSSVIRLDIRDEPAVKTADEKLLFRVVRAAFGQRRKTLVNALSSGLSITKATAARALDTAGISPTIRGERLTLQNFAAVADMLREQGVC
jgi:16S rRNA (adenine1518-N6/adenine1519-N6)-dimethyltransferase